VWLVFSGSIQRFLSLKIVFLHVALGFSTRETLLTPSLSVRSLSILFRDSELSGSARTCFSAALSVGETSHLRFVSFLAGASPFLPPRIEEPHTLRRFPGSPNSRLGRVLLLFCFSPRPERGRLLLPSLSCWPYACASLREASLYENTRFFCWPLDKTPWWPSPRVPRKPQGERLRPLYWIPSAASFCVFPFLDPENRVFKPSLFVFFRYAPSTTVHIYGVLWRFLPFPSCFLPFLRSS